MGFDWGEDEERVPGYVDDVNERIRNRVVNARNIENFLVHLLPHVQENDVTMHDESDELVIVVKKKYRDVNLLELGKV
jgi:hypothetical protein